MNIEYIAFALNMIFLALVLVEYLSDSKALFKEKLVTFFLIIKQKQENMANEFETGVKAILAEIDESTNNIAADIERWAVKVAEATGISSATQAQLLAEMKAASDKLRLVAATTPEDEPVVDPLPGEEEIAPAE